MNILKSIFVVILFSSGIVLPQRTLPASEHFNYSTGELRIVGAPDWTRIAGTSNDLLVVTDNLSYSGYPMLPTGNRIQIVTGIGDDYKLTIESENGYGKKFMHPSY